MMVHPKTALELEAAIERSDRDNFDYVSRLEERGEIEQFVVRASGVVQFTPTPRARQFVWDAFAAREVGFRWDERGTEEEIEG